MVYIRHNIWLLDNEGHILTFNDSMFNELMWFLLLILISNNLNYLDEFFQ